MMSSQTQQSRLPNGPASAAMLAGGIGVCMFGVVVLLSEARPDVAARSDLIESVGPLSGKVTVAIVIWLVSWVTLHKVWGRSQVDFSKTSRVAFALIIAGSALTFPPIFRLFEG